MAGSKDGTGISSVGGTGTVAQAMPVRHTSAFRSGFPFKIFQQDKENVGWGRPGTPWQVYGVTAPIFV